MSQGRVYAIQAKDRCSLLLDMDIDILQGFPSGTVCQDAMMCSMQIGAAPGLALTKNCRNTSLSSVVGCVCVRVILRIANWVSLLGPSRYTNVFDESKINRIRWIAMFWTEYNDTLKKIVNRIRFRTFTVMQVSKNYLILLFTFNDRCDIIISF